MADYIISDLHIGQIGISKFRYKERGGIDFKNDEEHTELLVENILSTSGVSNNLKLLGDCFFNDESIQHLHTIIEAYGTVELCLGNHDFEYCTSPRQVMLDLLTRHANFSINGFNKFKSVWFSHCPIHVSELTGRINIHGHVHMNTVHDKRYMNACAENVEYKPVDYEDIINGYRGTYFNYRLFDR